MKKYLIIILLSLSGVSALAQLTISSGAQWVIEGSPSVVLQDMNMVNDGTITSGTGTFKFTGIQNSTISGSGIPGFYILEMAKTNSAKLIILPFNLLVTLLILKFLSENSLVCISVYKRIKAGIK